MIRNEIIRFKDEDYEGLEDGKEYNVTNRGIVAEYKVAKWEVHGDTGFWRINGYIVGRGNYLPVNKAEPRQT